MAQHLKPIVVGQAPSRSGSSVPLFPIVHGTAGERLFSMSGLTQSEWFERLDTANTLPTYPGPSPSGSRGDAARPADLRRWASLKTAVLNLRSRRVLFVGTENARAYEWPRMPHAMRLPDPFTWVRQDLGDPRDPSAAWAWIPHTSGIVQFWNDPENRKRVPKLFRELLA